MNNVRNNIRKDFTVTPNALINDDELTPQARFRGFLCSEIQN